MQLRHGPATVIGESFGTVYASLCPVRPRRHGINQSLSLPIHRDNGMGRRRRVTIQESGDLPRRTRRFVD